MKLFVTIATCLTLSGVIRAQNNEVETPREELARQIEEYEQHRNFELRCAALDSVDRLKVTHLREFLTLYPDASVVYSSLTGAESPSLVLVVTLHDRYQLAMFLPVKYSATNEKVVGYESPQFTLSEVAKVVFKNGIISETQKGDFQQQFGRESWKKLVKAKEAFSVLGFELKKDSPVSNFEFLKKYLKSEGRQITESAEQSATKDDSKVEVDGKN